MSFFELSSHLARRALLTARNDDTSYQLYRYKPSVAAAILFIVLFTLTTVLHLTQMIRTRTWFFIPFCVGGLCEMIGFIARTVNAYEPYRQWSLVPFIVQSVFPLVAPALFAASIYMELGRIVELVQGDGHLFIKRRFLTGIFVTGDVISFFMQGGGGGLMGSNSLSTVRLGEKVIVGGLFVQITFFGIFVLAAAIFHRRMRMRPTSRSLEVPWQKHMFALYTVSVLILGRSVFRVVEFLQGNNGYTMHTEAFLYVFDATLMLLVMFCMNWFHPSEIRSLLKGGPWARGFALKRCYEGSTNNHDGVYSSEYGMRRTKPES